MASGRISSHQLSLSTLLLAPNEAGTRSSIELKMAISMQTQHPAINGCSPDHTYKLLTGQ
jgi:hypothetical protein